jgi:predicted AlkP superfamily pyrophosphatase or phosphodiesterase
MKKIISGSLAVILSAIGSYTAAAQDPPQKPKLVIAIIVDQFRYDYTTRFRARYTAGLDKMLSQGAVFLDAHQDHFPTVTATGHTAFMSGAVPATSGIIANDWYDRASGKTITSVEDSKTTLVGVLGDREGSSPHNLIISTLGDEIKIADRGSSKVIGISMKDRAAILPSGRMADAAYWFDGSTGNVVSSTWYQKQLPKWASDFNAEQPALKALGAAWYPVGKDATSSKPLMVLPKSADKSYFSQWEETPYANEMLEDFAERVIKNEDLGHHDGTDLLTVSFSANDHLGHTVGPDALEVEDMCVRTDAVLGKLLDAAEKQVGRENLLVVLSADHGVSPVPEVNEQRKMPGGRINKEQYIGALDAALVGHFGEGKWILGTGDGGVYLNDGLIAEKKLKHSAVEDVVAAAMIQLPYVERTYTRTELLKNKAGESQIDRYMASGFFAQRSADVFAVFLPYYLYGKSGTSHGSTFNYDSHVPLIFYGGSVKPAVYPELVGISDVAPTLAAILHVETPSGSVGHILGKLLVPPTKPLASRSSDINAK